MIMVDCRINGRGERKYFATKRVKRANEGLSGMAVSPETPEKDATATVGKTGRRWRASIKSMRARGDDDLRLGGIGREGDVQLDWTRRREREHPDPVVVPARSAAENHDF